MTGTADILVAGDHGAAVRIIDRRPEAARPSRALILHPRTLEVLRPLGVTQALLARADVAPTADLQLGSRLPGAPLLSEKQIDASAEPAAEAAAAGTRVGQRADGPGIW